MDITRRNWNTEQVIKLRHELLLSRTGIPKERADYWIREMENAKMDMAKRIYPAAIFGIQFDRAILDFFREDNHIKNYKWWYARHKSRKIPLEKYTQVFDAIIEYLENMKMA